MQSERLGVITFFGILIPGTYLVGILLLAAASVLELSNIHGHVRIFEFMSKR